MKKILWEYLNDEDVQHLDTLIELKNIFADCETWIGHTNFNISKDDVNKVNALTGVEFAYFHSRYRFSVAVGKLFHFVDVKPLVEKLFKIKRTDYSHIPIEFREMVSNAVQDLSFNKYWVLKLKSTGEPDIKFGSKHRAEVSLTLKHLMDGRQNEEKILTNLKEV